MAAPASLSSGGAGDAPHEPSALDLELARESERLESATPEERLAFAVARWGEKLLFTSSFGAGAGVMLHLWSRVASHLPVVVIDTGFLFDETIEYRDRLAKQLGLRIEVARPAQARDDFLVEFGADIMGKDPDFCCARNKIAPVQPYIARSLAWVSGLRRDQSKTREHVPILQPTNDGPVKVHPLATMTAAEANAYLETHGIPEHPLKARRYLSIGCWPCTQPVPEGGDERAGRWAGKGKTECGLHTFLEPTAPPPKGR
jgi:phosphoadenosine phosphosulfate reductase